MSKEQSICSASHECSKAKGCAHAVPHTDEFSGWYRFATCNTGGIVSACVPFKDGGHTTVNREWCPHCNGRGFEDVKTFHKFERKKT